MILRFSSFKDFLLFRLGIIFLLSAFVLSSSGIWDVAQAQTFMGLPAAGTMVTTSPSFEPLQLKGIMVNSKNPLRFDFLVDKGGSGLQGPFLKDGITRLAKYFLTCLAVPEEDLWVNLSPYEKDRIVPGNFGITLMGKDLLEQDYLLKQVMASLSYPGNELGKRFWQKIYRRAYELYGTTSVPINTFNKVWILPESAEVYVQGSSAFVVKSRLDVMLEADYKAFIYHRHVYEDAGAYSEVLRDVILPELRQEVNEGKNFAVVRQVYNAMILATWYKRHLKDSLLGRIYVGRNKVTGVDIADKDAKEKIFRQYLKAYKKCVYNYIKEDYDPITQQTVPHKYASGGMYFAGFGPDSAKYMETPDPDGIKLGTDLAMATVDLTATGKDGEIFKFSQQGRQDEITLSKKIGAFARGILLSFSVLTAFAAAAPLAHAFQQIPGSNPEEIAGIVEKGDLDLGHIIQKFDKINPLFGEHGVVLKDALYVMKNSNPNVTDINKIYVGQTIRFPKPASVSRQMQQQLPSAVPVSPAPPVAVRSFLPTPVAQARPVSPTPTAVKPVSTAPLAALPIPPAPPAAAPASSPPPPPPKPEADIFHTLSAPVANAVASSAPVAPPIIPNNQPADSTATEAGAASMDPEAVFRRIRQDRIAHATPEMAALLRQTLPPENAPGPNVTSTITTPSAPLATGDSMDPEDVFKRNRQQREKEAALSHPAYLQTVSMPIVEDAQQNHENYLSWGTVTIVLTAVGLGLLGLRTRGYTLNGLSTHKTSNNTAGPAPLSPQLSGIPPVFPDPTDQKVLLDVALPPPAASSGEEQILAEDLAKLRDVASGKVAPPPPIPAEEDPQDALLGSQSLRWMDISALLGGLGGFGLSIFLDGGVSWMLLAMPFVTRGLYVLQKWLHEIFHPAAASVLYPDRISAAWSGNNLKGHNSLGQWFKSLLPGTRVARSYVNLPFANAEGNWWDKLRNRLVGWSGLFGSMAVAAYAGHMMLLTPFLVPFLASLILSSAAVLKGSVQSGDLLGSSDTDQGKFGCGIIVLVKSIASQGITKKEIKPVLNTFFRNVKSLTVRGGQQAGGATNLADKPLLIKITKQLRNWYFWLRLHDPVFYRNMIDDLHARFYKALPRKLVPVYNYAKSGVIKFLFHVRFATGGDMVPEAAQPFTSPNEKREVWVFDTAQNKFRKVVRYFRITFAFNGDHDGSKIGVPYRLLLKERMLKPEDMRSFYSAAVHSYYNGRVTIRYLKKGFSEAEFKPNYGAVLRALRKKRYINFWGYVNREFKGVDEEFKSWFPAYNEKIFNQINDALFGMAPGDGTIPPLEQHLDLTQGSWFASVRYAHVMANHHDLQEAKNDILFEKQGRMIGRVFSEVYDQVEPFISRRGYNPSDPELVRTLNDLYVKDEKTARKLGLEYQFRMIEIFKDMLDKRMAQEAGQQTLAGKIFRQWEKKWKRQGMDLEHMRRLFIDVAVEKFFTADNTAATKEFAESSDGTYGLYMNSSLDDSITFYQDNQDVIIGLNRKKGYYGAASDPRVLKSIGPDGQQEFEEVMHLKDGEIVRLSFSPSNEIIVRSWIRVSGEWKESTKEELEKRFYPTAREYVDADGVKKINPYYAPPGVQYDNPRQIVQEDLRNTSKVLAQARAEWNDSGSFNMQSTDYLSERIADNIKKNGRARVVLIGFDNSHTLTKQFKEIGNDLIDTSKVSFEPVDANEFDKSPSAFNIQPDDIILMVSKSGATFSTKLALRIIKTLVNPKNIFCMGARIDSVLNTMIGQGLRPGKDKFTKRVFVTGEFYPAETPVVSEVLLMFQLQQLAVNLARRLEKRNDARNSIGLKFPTQDLERIAPKITAGSLKMAQELTGYDISGKAYKNADKKIKAMGTYLGKVALEPFIKTWFMRFFVAGVLLSPALLLGHYLGWGILLNVAINVFWISVLVPVLAANFYRKRIGRPKNGGYGTFQLFIAAKAIIHKTQRNFFSRIMTNKFSLMGPTEPLGGDPEIDFTANYASAVKAGDIILRFFLAHKENEGSMGVNQTVYPKTEVFGPTIKGKAQILNVEIKVPHEEGAGKDEIRLMDNTVGVLGEMIAAKTIGVEMSRIASWNGRFFDTAFTISSAGVYTTRLNPISEEARMILDSGREKTVAEITDETIVPLRLAGDNAMGSLSNDHNPGGINMNSRLMRLKITGDLQNRIEMDKNLTSEPVINGVVPKVSQIVTVTPDMLRAMLGEGYLN